MILTWKGVKECLWKVYYKVFRTLFLFKPVVASFICSGVQEKCCSAQPGVCCRAASSLWAKKHCN